MLVHRLHRPSLLTTLLFLLLAVVGGPGRLVEAASCVQVVDFVADCGAVANSAADNSARWDKCVSLAHSTGLPIYVPPGRFFFNTTISSSGVKVQGAGQAVSIFYWSVDASSPHTPAWTVSSLVPGDTWIRDMNVQCVCGRQALGVNGCNRDGIWLNSAVQLNNIEGSGFLSALVWNSTEGHTICFGCHFTKNYYGLYVAHSGGDNLFMAGGLEGNTMASIGVPADTYMGPGDLIWRTHMCFGPYGVYKEGSLTSSEQLFMKEVVFYLARFEACGNGFLYSENAAQGAGILDAVEFQNVGGSWSTTYQITSRDRDYGVYVGGVQQEVVYSNIQATTGFSAGTKGIWYLGPNYGDVGGLVKPEYTSVNITAS